MLPSRDRVLRVTFKSTHLQTSDTPKDLEGHHQSLNGLTRATPIKLSLLPSIDAMPPHLHPRSAATSTLFAATLVASFVVVGIPHVFPCPRPRKTYADSQRVQLDENGEPVQPPTDNRPQRSRIQPKKVKASGRNASSVPRDLEDEATLFQQLKAEADILEKEARECPVPKPTGWFGRTLGFENAEVLTRAESKPMRSEKG